MPPITETIEPKKVLEAQKHWQSNPIEFSQTFFASGLWDKQQAVMLALRDYSRVAVKSGNTVGKSRVAAEIALWFLISHYPSKIIITAPTFNQIQNILFKEIAKLYNNSVVPIGGEMHLTELKLNEEWFMIGISTDEVNRFQGFHSPNLLVIIDEALGVEPMIWEAIDGLHPSKILAIGNPLTPEGSFFNCFSSLLWHKVQISCQECVDWQKKNRTIPGLVTQQWINERREEWGEGSPLYQARVLGEFPTEGTDVLIAMKWVDKARDIEISEPEDALKIVSNDVASKHGQSSTVIGYRIGHTLMEVDIYNQIPTTMTTRHIKHKYEMKKADTVVVDMDGIGEGVGDMLEQYKIMLLEFHGGYASKAQDAMRFRNLRSQFYYIVAKKFEKGLYSLKYLPQHIFDKLKSQLCSIRVKLPDGQGRFRIESKEDMMARGLTSPDLADMFMMSEFAYYIGKMGDLEGASYR